MPAPDCKIVDTLIASRLILPNIDALDGEAKARHDPPMGKLTGSHSLEAWGVRFGQPKIGLDIKDWSTWTPEMQARCVGDTRLTKALWRALQPDGQPAEALELERRVAIICDEVKTTGIPFDVAAGKHLRDQWTARRAELEGPLRAEFPEVKNWNSHPQKVKLLLSLGWVPEKKTKTGKPSLTKDVVETLPQLFPEFAGLAEYSVLGIRLGSLEKGDEAWLRQVGPDGRIHGTILHIGTPHSRASHFGPNIAAVPNEKKGSKFGYECRDLFRSADDRVFVACDQAGLQDRAFAHYLAEFDGGAYARAYVAGLDAHWNVTQALGLVPTGTVRDKESRLHKTFREGCKSFRYAFLFGAGALKLGTIMSSTIRAADPSNDAAVFRTG